MVFYVVICCVFGMWYVWYFLAIHQPGRSWVLCLVAFRTSSTMAWENSVAKWERLWEYVGRKQIRSMMTFLNSSKLIMSGWGRLVFWITSVIHPFLKKWHASCRYLGAGSSKSAWFHSVEVANEARQYRIVGLYDQLFGEAVGSLFATGSPREMGGFTV